MSDPATNQDDHELVELKNPLWAAGLALLLPGLGHLYQGRYAKGILFMACILPTYFFGWSLGGGRVVYAQWQPGGPILEQRLHYACQFWVGLPAWPALIQTLFGNPLGDEFMRAPELPLAPGAAGEEAEWHEKYHGSYEMGTVYTMIAGILNFLVIFDAAGGPIGATIEEEDKRKKKKKPESPSSGKPGFGKAASEASAK